MWDDFLRHTREALYTGLSLLVIGSVWLLIADSSGNIFSTWNIIPILMILIGGMLLTGGVSPPAGCLVSIVFLGIAIKGLTTATGTVVLLLILFAAGCFAVPFTAAIIFTLLAIAVYVDIAGFISEPSGIAYTGSMPSGELKHSERIVNAALFCITMFALSVERAWGETPVFSRVRRILRIVLRAIAIIAPIALIATFIVKATQST